MKLCIGIPTNGTVKAKTLFSVVQMLKKASFEYELIVKESCVIHWNREHIVKFALEHNCTHVLFIDSDMFFGDDVAEKLLKWDKDIIGASVNNRQFPHQNNLKKEDENGKTLYEELPNGLAKCAGIGTGFLLIKTEVFKVLTHPWFFWEASETTGEVTCGEDFYFCKKARQAGFDIWADLNLKVQHIGEALF